jgi:hypothetical protein
MVLLAGAILLSSAAGPAGAADTVTLPQSLPDLVQTYGVEDVPVDILVTIDTSGSMASDGEPPPWPAVANGWATLASSVGPSDRIGLVTFDVNAVTRFNLDPLADDARRAEAAGRLPAAPEGVATDIGAGLEASVAMLAQSGASEIQTLVFITDGAHNPGPDSTYPTTSGPAWDALVSKAAAVSGPRGDKFSVYGWGLGGSGTTDIGLVKKVFPQAQILALPDRQIGDFLASLADNAQRERVRPEVAADLEQPITAELRVLGDLAPQTQAELVLRNPRAGLATDVALDGLTITEADGTEVPDDLQAQVVQLAPGEELVVPVTLSPAGADHGFAIGEQVDAREWSVQVQAATSLPESVTTLLATEQIADRESAQGAVEAAPTAQAGVDYGIPVWLVVLGLVLLALLLWLAAALWRWFFVPPPLTGLLQRREPTGEYETVTRLRGKTVELPGNVLDRGMSDDRVLLFTKPKDRRGRVYARALGGSPRLGGQLLTRQARRLGGGSVFQIGDHTISYQKQ